MMLERAEMRPDTRQAVVDIIAFSTEADLLIRGDRGGLLAF